MRCRSSIALLQTVVATQLVCVLRYTMNSTSVAGITSETVSDQFAEHAKDERKQMLAAAERIDQLGGVPNFDPEGLASRAATEYGVGGNLVQMIKDNLVVERLVIEPLPGIDPSLRRQGPEDPRHAGGHSCRGGRSRDRHARSSRCT